jgi:hypothetical protein
LDSKKVTAVASNSKNQTFIVCTGFFGTTDVISIYEDGKLRQENLPEKVVAKQMLVDKYDNLWISGHSTLLCRKANGEYVLYNSGNSPIPKNLIIDYMFLFGDELRLIIDEDELDKDDGLPKSVHPTGSLGVQRGPGEKQLGTFISTEQVLIYDTGKMK